MHIRNLLHPIVAVLVVLGMASGALAQGRGPAAELQAGAPTVISYQGRATVAGLPYTGTGYFKFVVTDAAGTTSFWSIDGTSANGGEPAASVALTVTNGLFSVLLGDTSLPGMTQPLDAAVFAGTDRALRVWFGQAAGGPFQQLAPDRRIAAAPYALQAQEVADAATLAGASAAAYQQHYAGVVAVAKSGGDFTTITAALDSITDASDTHRYLVHVAPGVYTERVTMKPHVDIQGAGELTTRITQPGSEDVETGTVVAASEAELRYLAVENTGGATWAKGIFHDNASPHLTHVTAIAANGIYNFAVYVKNGSSLVLTDVTATASGGDYSLGVAIYGSSPAMTHVTASASGAGLNYGVLASGSSPALRSVTATAAGGGQSYGVWNEGSSPAMMGVTATASGASALNCGVYNSAGSVPAMNGVTATASGGSDSRGVYNSASSPTMTGVIASGSGGASATYGVYNEASSPVIGNSAISAGGATGNRYGIYNTAGSGAYTVTLDNSQVTGDTASIYNDAEFTMHIGASKLAGSVVENGGAVTYDAGYRLNADTLDGQHAAAFQRKGSNTRIVAVSGGDYNSIGAALAAITDAGPENRYLVRVMPGVYTETVTMKPYVDIEGAGQLATRITYSGSDSEDTGTVVGADNAELRLLTVENTGGGAFYYATAIFNGGVSPVLIHVTASAGGSWSNRGVTNKSSAAPAMTHVTATASGEGDCIGVYNQSSSPAMTGVTATAASTGAYAYSYGIYNYGSSPAMRDITVLASGSYAVYGVVNLDGSPVMTDVCVSSSGGIYNLAIHNEFGSVAMTGVSAIASGGEESVGILNAHSSVTMTRVTADASGGSSLNRGAYNGESSATISDSTLSAGGTTGNRYGIYNAASSGAYTVTVGSSQVTGDTNSVYNASGGFTVRVAASQLAGGAVYNPAGGTVTCAGVYDEYYTFYASTCP